ncbi:50S ribosomal protein L11 methyltransferase, partial [Flavihumibacter sediminis]|nr:50S ribosomal protein L11 methyltransferase [Flavihumibacter sediminis]
MGNFCLIRADFHPGSDSVRHDLIITPKMSFGTGHHATTYQMVDAMQELDFTAKSVLDFGTGTGILAILAAKMGAASVVAIDNDSWSIENTKENIERNQVKGISVLELDHLDDM